MLTMTIEKHYTVQEVADMLRVTTRTVRRWIAEKRIEAIALPGKTGQRSEWRIPRRAIEAIGFRFEPGEVDDE